MLPVLCMIPTIRKRARSRTANDNSLRRTEIEYSFALTVSQSFSIIGRIVPVEKVRPGDL